MGACCSIAKQDHGLPSSEKKLKVETTASDKAQLDWRLPQPAEGAGSDHAGLDAGKTSQVGGAIAKGPEPPPCPKAAAGDLEVQGAAVTVSAPVETAGPGALCSSQSCANRIVGFRCCPFTTRIRLAMQAKGVQFEETWNPKDWFTLRLDMLALIGGAGPDGDRRPCQLGDDDDAAAGAFTGDPEAVQQLSLHHGTHVVTGAADEIIHYIDATFQDPPLIPQGGGQEQAVREWTGYVKDKFSPLVLQLLCESFGRGSGTSSREQQQQELVAKSEAVFGRLDHAMWEHSNGGPFFFGSQFTMADVYLIPFLDLVQLVTYFRGLQLLPAHARLLAYSKRMQCFSEYAPVMLDVAALRCLIAKTLPDEEAPPLVTVTMLQHRSILKHLERTLERVEALRNGRLKLSSEDQQPISSPAGVMKQHDGSSMKQVSQDYGQLVDVMQEHAQMEEKVLFPALEQASPGITHVVVGDHARDLPIMNGIREDLKSLAALEATSSCCSVGDEADLLAVTHRLQTLLDHTRSHFNDEEKRVLSSLDLAASGLGRTQQEGLVTRCMAVMEASHSHLLAYMLSGLSPDDIHQYMGAAQKCLGESKPVLLRRMIQLLKGTDDEQLQSVWNVIREKLPALATRWDTPAAA